MKKIAVLLFLISSFCFATDEDSKQNVEPKENPIKTIVVCKTKEKKNLQDGIIVEIKLPGSVDTLKEILKKYLNKEVSNDLLYGIKNDVTNYFIDHGYDSAFVRVLKDENQETSVFSGTIYAVVEKKEVKDRIKDDSYSVPLKGVFLCHSDFDLNQNKLSFLKGVLFNIDLPGDFKSEVILRNSLERLFINKEITKDTLCDIKNIIIDYYKENKRPIVSVNIPNQKISSGILVVFVDEAKLSNINVIGNKYFSKDQYLKMMKIKKGDFISEEKLLKGLTTINRNPFRDVDIIYKPGKEKGTTDIDLFTRERRPLRMYYASENTGLDYIGKNRFLVGLVAGNLFKAAHVLSYQLTKSYYSHAFEAHTMQYVLPLPIGHFMTMYGGAAKIEANLPSWRTATSKGRSFQGSLRYDIPLPEVWGVIQDIIFGFDFKRTNNTVEFTQTLPIFGKNANLTQLVLTYETSYARGPFQANFDINLFWSPGQIISDQSNTHYQSLRAHAKVDYFYTQLNWKSIYNFIYDISFSLFMKLQFSNRNLLASEQFGIGGYYSVRGYDEHFLSGDNGCLLSAEIRLPSFGFLNYFINKKIPDSLQILGFVDYGREWVDRRELGVRKTDYLLSMGPGLRYVIDPFLSLRLDWGFKRHKRPFWPGDSKLHFGVNINF